MAAHDDKDVLQFAKEKQEKRKKKKREKKKVGREGRQSASMGKWVNVKGHVALIIARGFGF